MIFFYEMQLLRMRTCLQQWSSAWHVLAGKMPPSVRIVKPLSPRLVKAASLPLLLYRRPLFASLGEAQSDKRHVLVASMPPSARIISASTSRPLFPRPPASIAEASFQAWPPSLQGRTWKLSSDICSVCVFVFVCRQCVKQTQRHTMQCVKQPLVAA